MLVFTLTWQRLHVSSGDQVTRLDRWLIRKIRHAQHKKSHCGVLNWRVIQTKSWTCNLVSFWIQFNCRTQISHLREGKQDGHITCLWHINLCRTCFWNCWKVNIATYLAGFCLRISKHEKFVTTVVMPQYHACFLNLSIAAHDPIDSVQPRSDPRVLDGLARLNGVTTIHAV